MCADPERGEHVPNIRFVPVAVLVVLGVALLYSLL
jgi:hypothetical protein